MKISVSGLGLARKELLGRRKRLKNQKVAWQSAAKMLDRRYDRKWFVAGNLTSVGGGPEDDKWPGLKPGPYVEHKLKVNKNIKLKYDGTMKLSYFAQAMASGRGLITGVRDTDREKLADLTKMGFNLMMLEDTMRDRIFKLVSGYIATGKLR